MCCSSEQLLVGSEFGTDPNNGCKGDYFPPRPAKNCQFVILLCLMPDDLLIKGEPLSVKG